MERNQEHLELASWRSALPRRKRASRPPTRPDKMQHGARLAAEVEQVANSLKRRIVAAAPQGVNPKLVFKLILHPRGNLDEQTLRQLGLRVLGIDSRKAMVVFPDQSTLEELTRRIEDYAGLVPGGHEYSYLASIEAIEELTRDDRIGPILARTPLAADEIAALDIELWHTGDTEECRRNVREIRNYLQELSSGVPNHRSLRVTDDYVGQSLCILRARLDRRALEELTSGDSFDYVKEIDRRPKPTFDLGDLIRISLTDIDVGALPVSAGDEFPGIVVIDSGVAQLHPLIAPALADAQVFPDWLGGPEDGDEKTHGHGTAVSGIAVYGDVGACLQAREFAPTARLFSARVTDANNEYCEDVLLEHQLEHALTYFLGRYPEARVINISLGNEYSVCSDEKYQFRFASVVDDLAYRFREKELVFVVAAGNYRHDCEDDEEIIRNYPRYLLESDDARIIDPATSAIAITVGGLSYGEGRNYQTAEFFTDRSVAGHRDWPSPFTRTGWGFGGAVKPEVVDYAGDLRFMRGKISNAPTFAGLPSTAKAFGPPEGRLLRTVAGTSFAAPRVANLASRLIREFPDASSNLIRALILDSARVPRDRPSVLKSEDQGSDQILRLYGYGQPDFERARWSGGNNVLLLADSVMELDTFRIFTIPSLPDAFFLSEGAGYLSVSLAFDPLTRHTRADSYLGVTMQFDLFRNVSADRVADAIRSWNNDERATLQDLKLPSLSAFRPGERSKLKPGIKRRSRGTAQRATIKVLNEKWKYDGEPLIIAVVCQRKWAPQEIVDQRFALVASIYHENPELDLYAHIRQQARVYQRVRIRV